MGEERAFYCDVCGAKRKEANHWWILYLDVGYYDSDVCCCVKFDTVVWSKIHGGHTAVLACGEAHAQEIHARWMATGKLTGK